MLSFTDLIVAVDRSVSLGLTFYSLVYTRLHHYPTIRSRGKWVRELRRLPASEKRRYIKLLPSRFKVLSSIGLRGHLTFTADKPLSYTTRLCPKSALVIVDDQLYSNIVNVCNKVEKESTHKRDYFSTLTLLADNLVNLGRVRAEVKCKRGRTRCITEVLEETIRELGLQW